MNWINISEELPTYYKCVIVKLTTDEVVEAWRASNGEYNIWNKTGTDQILFDDDIVCWKNKT